MIRVLHMTSELSAVGGTARKLAYLARYSDAANVQHCFIAMQGGEFVSQIESAGGHVIVLDSESPLALIRTAYKVARQWRPHIIATHFTRSFLCGMCVAHLLRIPLIHHEHGPATLDRSKHTPGKLLGKLLRRWWLPHARVVICNSSYTAQALSEMFAVDTERVQVIYNPVEKRVDDDLPDQSGAPRVITKNKLCIGHVGGLVPWRDHATLINAVKLLKDQHWDVQLLLVGAGPMRHLLEQQTKRLNVESSVVFMNFQRDLAAFYESIDVYVNPALAEGFGIAVVEAMLQRKPVVLANAGAHPELVEDDRTGVLFVASDPGSLAEKLKQLGNTPDQMRRIALAGYEHARQKFAPQRYANSYLQLLQRVVAQSSDKHTQDNRVTSPDAREAASVTHVVHVLAQLDTIGGTARMLLYLLKHSNRATIRHSFVCMEYGELQSEFEKAGASVRVIHSTRPMTVLNGIRRFVHELQPDVLATHFTRPLICSAAVARFTGIPVIHNEHGAANSVAEDAPLSEKLSARLRRLVLRSCKAVICNSHYTAGTIASVYGVKQRLLRPLHLPVESRTRVLESFSNRRTNTVRLGHIGGMIPLRDQVTLIRAVDILKRTGFDTTLILIGDGPERSALELLTTQLNLQVSIIFMGYQDNLESFFNDIDIYVNAAVAEGFGIAVVEAMMARKPVVIANAGAHPELIEDGISGLLHEPHNAMHLAECVLTLVNQPAYAQRLAEAGYHRALNMFSAQHYANQFEGIVRNVLNDPLQRYPTVLSGSNA